MKRNYIKFAIDLIMAVMFVLFFNTRVLGGLSYHEISGLFFAAMYFTHIFLNLQWVKKVTIRIFDKKLPWKTRGSYALNLLLLTSMSFIIVSGIIISRIVFPNINLGNEGWFKVTHISISFLVLLLVGIHVGLHWHWVVNVWKKMWKFKSKNKWVGIAAKVVAALILVFGIYEVKQIGFIHRVASSTSIIGIGNTVEMKGHGDGDFIDKSKFGSENRPNFNSPNQVNNPNENSSDSSDEVANSGFQPRGDFHGEKPDFDGRKPGGMEGHEGRGGGVFNVILTYTGVMAVFVIITYYIRKLTSKRKRKQTTKLH